MFPRWNLLTHKLCLHGPDRRSYTMACTGQNCTSTPPLFQLQTITDLRGNTLTFAPSGITSSVGGGTVVVPFVRDSQGRITKITDLNGNNYVYSYDTPCGTGNLCSVTFPTTPAGTSQATYTYLSDHSLNTQVDPNSNTTTYNYYPTGSANQGRLESMVGPSVAGPNGTQVQYTTQYNYCITVTVPPTGSCVTSNTTITTNPDGGVVTQVSDSFGKPLVITDALGRTTTYAYDSNENLITKTDALGNIWTYTYDSYGNQTSATDPLEDTSTKTYNQYAEVATSDDPLNQNPTTYTYDSNFNLKQVTDTVGQAYAATYDSMGDPLTQTDANGNTTQLSYDSRGNLLTAIDPLSETTRFSYDGMDRVLTQTDPRDNQTTKCLRRLGESQICHRPSGQRDGLHLRPQRQHADEDRRQ
jgi:YD repeat-containing protein